MIVDLGGRTIVPRFTDAHAHVWEMGHLLTAMLDLRQSRGIEALAKCAESRDQQLQRGQWLLGRLQRSQYGRT